MHHFTNWACFSIQILIVPGVLTQTPYARPAFIKSGGALGDLLQWADLIAAAHALGHDVTVEHDIGMAATSLRSLHKAQPCEQHDMIFADYSALGLFPADVLRKYK